MKRILCTLLLLPVLAACSEMKQTVGLGRNNPDEFTIVKNPPLTMPPDYDLRPPDATAQGAKGNEPAPVVAAKAVGADITVEDAGSPGLAALLSQAKATDAKPDIRAAINKDADGVVVKDKSFVDKLMVWDASTKAPDPTVDAKAEAVRVDDAKSKGDFISGDGVKFKQKKQEAPLEGVFN